MRGLIKRLSILISILVVILGLSSCSNNKERIQTPIRQFEIADDFYDKSYLSTLDNSKIKTEEGVTKFTGTSYFDTSIFGNIENLSIDENKNFAVTFDVEVDSSSRVVALNATLVFSDGTASVDRIYGYVIPSEQYDFDAILDLEGEKVLLSEVVSVSNLENCGWFTKLFKKVVDTVVSSVQSTVNTVVSTVTTTANEVYSILTSEHDIISAGAKIFDVMARVTISTIGENILKTLESTSSNVYKAYLLIDASANLSHNLKQTEPTSYINGQSYYSNWKFGLWTVDQNGCGVIAAYNVLHGLGHHRKFAQVIYDFDKSSGALALGFFGADPSHFKAYFNTFGLKCTRYYTYSALQSGISNANVGDMFLVCAWNGAPWEGAHYVAARVVKNNGKKVIEVFNRSNHDKTSKEFANFDDDIIGGELITAYKVTH